MKRFLLLCLTALCALTAWAYDFYDETSGIYYNILTDQEKAVEVTYYSYQHQSVQPYSGVLEIPKEVEYENVTYIVTGIGEYAFYNCKELISVSFPTTITSLGEYAFGYCTGLQEATFPEGITTTADALFYNCTGLTSVTLPESITSINHETFGYCTNLEEVTIGSQVTFIGYHAFQACKKLANFYSLNPEPPECELYDFMDMHVRYYGVFDDASLEICTLHVPQNSVDKYTGADQWEDFSSIVAIDETIIPPTIETLSVTDITNSTAILHGTVSAGSEEILGQGFQYWADVNSTQTIVATSVSDEEISSTIQRLSSATEYTFRAYATTATETYYGDRITFTTTNYDFAEENSEGQTIYYKILSSSGANRTCEVQYLYYASTDNVVAYEGELTIPETVTHEGTTYRVTTINEYAFYECRNLTKVTIPESVTDIGPNSFQNCTSLEEATFPNTVSTIWEYTFYGCTSLKEAIIPSSVTLIRYYAFCGCSNISEVTIPKTVTSLLEGVFANCTGLKKATLEEGGITSIDYAYLFAGCTSLEDVSLPSTMTKFGTYMFGGCTGLKSFTYPNSMTNTGFCAFYECTSLENVTFSRNITEISNGTFAYCTFEEMTVPEGVTTIGYQAFMRNPNLKTLSLPRSVTSIDYWVLRYCSNIEKLYSLNPTPPVRGANPQFEPFESMGENCVLYVPTGSKEAYSTADMWQGYFKDIVEIDVLSAETAEATDITKDSATLNGAVTKGTFDVTHKGFEYWTDPLVSTFIAVDEDNLTTTLSSLESGTTYYYRAYATDTTGTTYGETLSFTTDVPEGISSVKFDDSDVEGYYTISGLKLNAPQKGVNIIRYNDGNTKKVIMK